MDEKHAKYQAFMERQKREREEQKQTLDGTILLSLQCPRCRNVWNDYLLHVESFTPKIEDFRFHDLRHTFATKLAQAGVDLYKISKYLGHKSLDGHQVRSPLHRKP